MNLFSNRLRNLILLLGPVLFLAGTLYLQGQTLPASGNAAIPASAADWGLSFQTEGQPPIGNATKEDLAQYDAYYVGATSKKVIYFASQTAERYWTGRGKGQWQWRQQHRPALAFAPNGAAAGSYP